MRNLVIYSVKYHMFPARQWYRTYCWQVNGFTHEVYETEYRQAHRYPAVSYCAFCEWGKMKGKVYRENPNTTETVQSNLFIVQAET